MMAIYGFDYLQRDLSPEERAFYAIGVGLYGSGAVLKLAPKLNKGAQFIIDNSSTIHTGTDVSKTIYDVSKK